MRALLVVAAAAILLAALYTWWALGPVERLTSQEERTALPGTSTAQYASLADLPIEELEKRITGLQALRYEELIPNFEAWTSREADRTEASGWAAKLCELNPNRRRDARLDGLARLTLEQFLDDGHGALADPYVGHTDFPRGLYDEATIRRVIESSSLPKAKGRLIATIRKVIEEKRLQAGSTQP